MAKVPTRKVSLDEVAKHNTKTDAWIIIDNVVYDITQFGRSHPGGSIIYQYAGEDATDPFYAFHYGSGANKRLGMMRVGELDTPIRVSPLVSDFRALRDEIERKGMMNATASTTIQSWWGYLAIYFAALALFMYLPYSWFSLVFCAALFGFSWGQGGFVQHDLGHNSSFTKASKYNYPFHVFIFNGMMGGSADWWRGRHTRHHAYPNHADTDLDVRTLPLFAWDDQQLNMAFQKGLTNLKYQHWYFTFFGPPLIFVFYRILTLMWTIRNRMFGELATQVFWIVWQAALLLPKMEYNLFAYFTWHLIVLLASGTYLGWVFALNHTMFPVVRGPKDKDWVRSTCDATQNIVSPNPAVQTWLDWFTGHLDYQVEHHLFPNMPRVHYPALHKMLKPILQKHGVPLHESRFWDAVGQVFSTLKNASESGVKMAKEAAASKRAAKQDKASVVDDKSAVNNTRKTASLLR